MTNEATYHTQRMQQLANTLEWMVTTQQIGISLSDLVHRLGITDWEVNHLFNEFLGKEPLRLLQDAFSPSLAHIQPQAQLSIFDRFETNEIALKSSSVSVDLQPLISDPREITFARYQHFLGEVLIADCSEGILQITFEQAELGFERLVKTFPKSRLVEQSTDLQQLTSQSLQHYCVQSNDNQLLLPAVVKATPFQLRVWDELIKITPGTLKNYGEIATSLGDPKAARAVGTAIGANPLALLIPCHRVVHQSGKIGHFRWGTWRKLLLLAIEK